jgi:hypothetical protein
MDRAPTTVEILISGEIDDLPPDAATAVRAVLDCFDKKRMHGKVTELSPNFGDGLKDQAAA